MLDIVNYANRVLLGLWFNLNELFARDIFVIDGRGKSSTLINSVVIPVAFLEVIIFASQREKR